VESGKLDPTVFATDHFTLTDTMAAYDVFSRASETGALKVVLYSAANELTRAQPRPERALAAV
jgi:hypothetical protein